MLVAAANPGGPPRQTRPGGGAPAGAGSHRRRRTRGLRGAAHGRGCGLPSVRWGLAALSRPIIQFVSSARPRDRASTIEGCHIMTRKDELDARRADPRQSKDVSSSATVRQSIPDCSPGVERRADPQLPDGLVLVRQQRETWAATFGRPPPARHLAGRRRWPLSAENGVVSFSSTLSASSAHWSVQIASTLLPPAAPTPAGRGRVVGARDRRRPALSAHHSSLP